MHIAVTKSPGFQPCPRDVKRALRFLGENVTVHPLKQYDKGGDKALSEWFSANLGWSLDPTPMSGYNVQTHECDMIVHLVPHKGKRYNPFGVWPTRQVPYTALDCLEVRE